MTEIRPLDKMGLGTGLAAFALYAVVLLWAIFGPVGPTEPPAEPLPVMTARLDVGDEFVWQDTDVYVRPQREVKHGTVIVSACRPEPGAKARIIQRAGDRLLCETYPKLNSTDYCPYGTRFWMTVDGTIEP